MFAIWAPTALVLVLAAALSSASAAGLPEGPGLAAGYPGDRGIAGDPAVVLADSFEDGGLAGIGNRWQSVEGAEGTVLSLSGDVPAGSDGKHSLEMTVTWGTNTTGYLYAQLPRALDTAFARFYVKYDSEHFAYHCGTHLGGYNPPTPWPQGDPGLPKGDDWMQVEVMPMGSYGSGKAPTWEVACFWPDMKASAGGSYWGNSVAPARPALVALDRWQCVEVMMKCNSHPELADGELALWLDGELVMHVKQGARRGRWTGQGFGLVEQGGDPFEGFRWRRDADLKINFLWLLYNIMNPNPADPVGRVRFDNVVVGTQYIGPISQGE